MMITSDSLRNVDMKILLTSSSGNNTCRLQSRYVLACPNILLHLQLMMEKPLKKTEDEIYELAKAAAEGFDAEDMRNTFLDLTFQL